MDAGVVVEDPNAPQQRRFARGFGQLDVLVMQARLAARLDLVLQVDLRCGVLPDLHHGKPRTHTACGKGRDAPDKPLSELARGGVAVKDAGMHGEKSDVASAGKARILASRFSWLDPVQPRAGRSDDAKSLIV